jgi:hypothetical protein
MHPTEHKNAFLVMRGNGWSLGPMSKPLRVPKSTLFNLKDEPVTHGAISSSKSPERKWDDFARKHNFQQSNWDDRTKISARSAERDCGENRFGHLQTNPFSDSVRPK